MRLLDPAESETTMSKSDTKTRPPSIMFQPLRRYELASSTRPLDSTFHSTQRLVRHVKPASQTSELLVSRNVVKPEFCTDAITSCKHRYVSTAKSDY